RRPLLNGAQRSLRRCNLGRNPPQLEEIDEVAAFPPAGGHLDGTPRMEPTSGRRVHGIRNLAPRQHLPPASHRVWNRYGLQEGLRVWILWVSVDTLRAAHFDDSVQVDYLDLVIDEFRV